MVLGLHFIVQPEVITIEEVILFTFFFPITLWRYIMKNRIEYISGG